MKNGFRSAANKVSTLAGSPAVFLGALLVVLIWAGSGPMFDFSDTWQLVINTGTTIVTFLMVFLIQNTQNRDGKAMQIKLDELIRATKGARMKYVSLEDLTDEEIDQLNRQFQALAKHPNTTRAIKKLHETIAAESEQRRKLPRFRLPGMQRPDDNL